MTYQEWLEIASLLGLKVTEGYFFEADDLNALILNDKIKISDKLVLINERKCALLEEIAHALLNIGNITDLRDIDNARQEHRAHRLAGKMSNITLTDIADTVLYYGDEASLYNVAEHLEITEEFLIELIENYKRTYGESVDLGSCIVTFVPTFRVKEKYK